MNNIFQILTNMKELYRIEHGIEENERILDKDLCVWIDVPIASIATYKNKGTIPYPTLLEICDKKKLDFSYVFFGGEKVECSECGDVLTDSNKITYKKNGKSYFRNYCKRCKNEKMKVYRCNKNPFASETCVKCDDKITAKNEVIKKYNGVDKRLDVCSSCMRDNIDRRTEKLKKEAITCTDCGKTKMKWCFTDGSVCNICKKNNAKLKNIKKIQKEKLAKKAKAEKKKKIKKLKKIKDKAATDNKTCKKKVITPEVVIVSPIVEAPVISKAKQRMLAIFKEQEERVARTEQRKREEDILNKKLF